MTEVVLTKTGLFFDFSKVFDFIRENKDDFKKFDRTIIEELGDKEHLVYPNCQGLRLELNDRYPQMKIRNIIIFDPYIIGLNFRNYDFNLFWYIEREKTAISFDDASGSFESIICSLLESIGFTRHDL